MKHIASLFKPMAPLLLGIWLTGTVSAEPLATTATLEADGKTILLVSLEDGSVIKQLIDVDADICFKQSTSSSTTCLTQGEPIFDAVTSTVIGFEMIENRIELVAKND